MNRGFISSALLYGILVIFLVIMLSTIAILGSRKLSIDKLKENALENSDESYSANNNVYAWYDTGIAPKTIDENKYSWTDQNGKSNATIYGENIYDITSNPKKINLNNSYIDTGIKLVDIAPSFTISMVISLEESGIIIGGYDGVSSGVKLYYDKENKTFDACYGGQLSAGVNTFTCLTTEIDSKFSSNSLFKITLVIDDTNGISFYINGEQYYDKGGNDSSVAGGKFKAGDFNLIVGTNVDSDKQEILEYIDISDNKVEEQRVGGNLLSLIVYNKALTSNEIKNNFEVDSKKYRIAS